MMSTVDTFATPLDHGPRSRMPDSLIARARAERLAAQPETATCALCGLAVTADTSDANGREDGGGAIWRDATTYGVCHDGTGENWHRPAGEHRTVCCWLTRCATCTPWSAARG